MPIKGESLRELMHLQRKINGMFQEMLQPEAGQATVPAYTWVPATDVCEDDLHYHVEMELPGVAIEDVTVLCQGERLRVSGERRPPRELSRENVQRVERYFGPFLRELAFPSPLDADKVRASLADGLLILIIPKKKTGRRRVPVR